jgi:hypothetical protein
MSTAAKAGRFRQRLLVAGAVALPIVLLTAYLIASRVSARSFSPRSDYLAFGAAILCGAFCLWTRLPATRWRPLVVLLYVPASAGLLFIFTLGFVCTVFGDCL